MVARFVGNWDHKGTDVIQFWDFSRSLNGQFDVSWSDFPLEDSDMQAMVMRAYDHNEHTRVSDPEYKLENAMRALSKTFDNSVYLDDYARQVAAAKGR